MANTAGKRVCIDGNEAATRVAHSLAEVIAIYPITPASPIGELAYAWSASARPNLWGGVPDVIEMQREGGAAGALHGALQKGALQRSRSPSSREARGASRCSSDPTHAAHLLALAQADADERLHRYQQMSQLERSVPSDREDPDEPVDDQ